VRSGFRPEGGLTAMVNVTSASPLSSSIDDTCADLGTRHGHVVAFDETARPR
jgi:hypothetical protein